MDEKFVTLKRYGGMRGLSEQELRRIADDCDQLELASGDLLHQSGNHLDFIYFVVQGRLDHTINDLHGNEVARKYLTRGSQFGAVAAAEAGPVPITVVAVEPSIVLRLDYQKFLRYVAAIPQLLLNLIQDIGTAFKQTFQIDQLHTRPNVVLLTHESPATRPLTHRLIDRLQELGERPCLLTDDPSWASRADIPQVLLIRDGHWMDDGEVREQIAKWAAHERVFIDVSSTIERPRLVRGFQLADLVLVCVRVNNYKPIMDKLRELESREPEWRQKTNLVWLLDGPQMHAPQADQLNELVDGDFKVSFSEPPENCGTILNHGIERIVHALRGVRLGIALGGGAARGMAHLGVLKVLEQNGIILDMIAGTSAGAMTGTLYASGMDVDHTVERFVKDLTPSWLFRRMRHGEYWYLLYKYRRNQFDPMLRRYLSDLRLEQLPIPMNAITVDLVSGEPKVRDRGDAVDGILESINLPGLSPPICRNGQALVDGGLVNNVPADVLVSKGCNFVIAVSVTAKLEKEFANIRPDSAGPRYKTPSVMQTIMRGYVVQNVNMNSVGVQPADLIIELDVTRFDLSEFTRTDELAAVGVETTEASIERIYTALADLDKQLFSATPCKQRL
jgi:predicted acylesterase/phospholipase RssA/CRP-like cAMP-binding protein